MANLPFVLLGATPALNRRHLADADTLAATYRAHVEAHAKQAVIDAALQAFTCPPIAVPDALDADVAALLFYFSLGTRLLG